MSLQKRCFIPDDIVSIILSFLGREIYLFKFTNKMHARFIKVNKFLKLNVLFMDVNYNYKDISVCIYDTWFELI
jgi:hypothetical protein